MRGALWTLKWKVAWYGVSRAHVSRALDIHTHFNSKSFHLYLFHKMGFHVHNYELRVPLIKTFPSYGSVQLWLKVILDAIWLSDAVLDPLELDVEAQLICCLNILSRALLRVKEDNPQSYGLGLELILK